MSGMMRVASLERLVAFLALGVIFPAANLAPSARLICFVRAQAAQVPNPDLFRNATLEVVAQDTGLPLAGATVFVHGTGVQSYTWEGVTDDQGRYTVVPPSEATRRFDVIIVSDEYARGLVSTVGHRATVVVKLRRGEMMGGVVQDDQGRPIAGARVFPFAFSAAWPEIEESPNSDRVLATTDAQGQWRSDALPVGIQPDTKIRVRVTHAEYVPTTSVVMASALRDGSSVQVMKPGVSVSGTVVSPFGRPVSGAIVQVVVSPLREGGQLRLTTDRNGEFHSSHCINPKSSGLLIVVRAPGLAWAVHDVAMAPRIPPQMIRMSRRRPLEGRVLDDRGRPVPGAMVASARREFGGLLGWETKTDAAGRFVWYDAPPARTIYLDAQKPGLPIGSQAVKLPESSEVRIILRRNR